MQVASIGMSTFSGKRRTTFKLWRQNRGGARTAVDNYVSIVINGAAVVRGVGLRVVLPAFSLPLVSMCVFNKQGVIEKLESWTRMVQAYNVTLFCVETDFILADVRKKLEVCLLTGFSHGLVRLFIGLCMADGCKFRTTTLDNFFHH